MTTRRASGEGSIFEETGRSWVGLLSLDNGKRRKVRGRTRAEVVRKLDALKVDLHVSGSLPDARRTVGDVLDLFAEKVLWNRDLAPATRDAYGHMLELIRAEFGRVRLDKLTAERVEDGLDRIATGTHGRGRPLSKRTLKYARGVLAQAIDVAIRRRWTGWNPARVAELPRAAVPAKPRRSLTRDEARAFWAGVEDERLGNLFRLMLMTGLRPGEALGVCWDAVDLDTGVLHVWRGVRRDAGRAVLTDFVKTSGSYRTITLPAPAVEVLRAQRARVAEMKLAARAWARQDHDLVFPTDQGTPWNPRNMQQEMTNICRRLDIDPPIKPHELRHSTASILSDAGVPLEVIADLLGHEDLRMLSEVYRHRIRPSVDGHVAVMDGMLDS